MAKIRRAGRPPACEPYVPVWRIKGTAHRQFVLVSPAIWGFFVHWVGNRTIPCLTKDHDVCACPYRTYPQKWIGYVKAFEIGGRDGFVELTKVTGNILLESVDEGTPLRGLCFEFWRSSAHRNARHLASLVSHITRAPAQLPQDSDPEELLLKLWGAPTRRTP